MEWRPARPVIMGSYPRPKCSCNSWVPVVTTTQPASRSRDKCRRPWICRRSCSNSSRRHPRPNRTWNDSWSRSSTPTTMGNSRRRLHSRSSRRPSPRWPRMVGVRCPTSCTKLRRRRRLHPERPLLRPRRQHRSRIVPCKTFFRRWPRPGSNSSPQRRRRRRPACRIS